MSVSIDPEIDALGKGRIVSKIRLTTKDGKTFFEESDRHYRGGPRNPLTYEEVSDKFLDATQNVLTGERARSFLSLTKNFETLPNLKELLNTVAA